MTSNLERNTQMEVDPDQREEFLAGGKKAPCPDFVVLRVVLNHGDLSELRASRIAQRCSDGATVR